MVTFLPGAREFFVAFYNMPRVEKIRAMATDKIGRLISISGTVTRSTEVRPELFYGAFLCECVYSVALSCTVGQEILQQKS
jgi:DNA replicative helicase MCM subunit Mcm2 (Cdc46/Mcm family)